MLSNTVNEIDWVIWIDKGNHSRKVINYSELHN